MNRKAVGRTSENNSSGNYMYHPYKTLEHCCVFRVGLTTNCDPFLNPYPANVDNIVSF